MNRALPLLALATSLALQSGCAGMVANSLMFPNRQPLVKTPADYGLDFEDVEFESTDGTHLAGWLMRGTGEHVVILTHPGSFTRYGFSTAHQGFFRLSKVDVEFLKTVRHLVDAGYTVLMFDFRNHGQSGTSPNGGITGVGLEEYRDVVAAVDYVAEHPDLGGREVALLSFCQGANSSIIAMSKDPEPLREGNLQALVAVQPISAGVFARAYGADVGVPQRAIARAERRMIERGSHALDDQSPLPYAGDVFVPTLFVQSLTDPWTDLHYVRSVYEAIPEPKQVLWLEPKMARFDTYNWFNDHPEPLLDFLASHLGQGATTIEPAPDAPEPAPDAPEPAPDAPEPAPDAPEPAPYAPEPAPADPAPAPADPAPFPEAE